jgi:hypothetical protein
MSFVLFMFSCYAPDMRRRGELSKGMIDRNWPHQVALPAPVVVARFNEINEAARRLSACTRTHAFRRDDVDHVVYCFGRPEDGEVFQLQFGGEMLRAKDRPRWPGR